MSATRDLASYLAELRYEDLPAAVQERAKLAVLDGLGIALGGFGLPEYSGRFLKLAKEVGGGVREASVIGDGDQVSLPLAAFANTALATTLDFPDHTTSVSGRCPVVLGALAVPSALAAAEVRGGTGKDLLVGVVAGYECAGRIIRSMDVSPEREREITGETVSIFAAAGAAGRTLGLDPEEMVSTLGMAGVYTPVPAGYKWLFDSGLRPRKEIKQGWAWMSLAGVFAAQSARAGFRMVQENNILDGERGLWRMLGMDIHREEELTRGLGSEYVILDANSKRFPGCAVTHSAIAGVLELVNRYGIPADMIQNIKVVTAPSTGIEFDDREPQTAQDMQFSIPYQVGASLSGYPRGPQWYADAADSARQMAARVEVGFDDECEQALQRDRLRMSKVTVETSDGHRFSTKTERAGYCRTPDELRDKFLEVSSHVISRPEAEDLLELVEGLDRQSDVLELVSSLTVREPVGAR